MKKFLLLALISSTSFAQSLDLSSLKQLMSARKDTLETVKVGMSKRLTTTGTQTLDEGDCEYTQISNQSILKIEEKKMVVLAKEKFTPADSPACEKAGYKSYEQSVLFYEERPSLAADLADLDASASSIKTISQSGNLVTMGLSVLMGEENSQAQSITLQYDLSKPSFRNLILNQGSQYKTISEDLADIDVNSVDLRKVLFCSNNDGDNSDCVEGDYSDILF